MKPREHLIDLIPEGFQKNWQELQELKNKRGILFPVVGKPVDTLILCTDYNLTIADIAAGKAEEEA